MRRIYQFSQCRVYTDFLNDQVSTVFRDGTCVSSNLQLTSDFVQRSWQLGYQGDFSACNREGVVLHTWLMEKLGYMASPHLWALTHPLDQPLQPILLQDAESSLVQQFQSLINHPSLPLHDLFSLLGYGLNLRELRQEAWDLLRK